MALKKLLILHLTIQFKYLTQTDLKLGLNCKLPEVTRKEILIIPDKAQSPFSEEKTGLFPSISISVSEY